MRPTRSLLLLLLVAALTAATATWRWPELAATLDAARPFIEAGWPVLATAVGGLLVVHLVAVLRLARLSRGGRGALPPRSSPAASPPATPVRPSPSAPAPAPDRSSATGRAEPRPKPIAREAESNPDHGDEPEKVERFLRVVLDDAEAEEISFLPPYASDEAEGGSFSDAHDEHSAVGADSLGGGGADALALGGPAPGEEKAGGVLGPEDPEGSRNVPIPRHFALGTVAIIKDALSPAQVAQVLVEQRKRPRERFGEIAVEMALLSHEELQGLLVAQQQGLFTDEEIREARRRIQAFREIESTASAQ